MEKFKLDNFKTLYHRNMPIVKNLSLHDSEELTTKLFNNLYIKKEDYFLCEENLGFVKIEHLNAEINEINWNKIFQVIGLPIPHEVYINDHKFEHLDVMLFSNFSKYFTDIWYPSADDIEIFDSSLNYIVAIRHYGALYYKKA